MPESNLMFNDSTPQGTYSAAQIYYSEWTAGGVERSRYWSPTYQTFLADVARSTYTHFIKRAYYINSTPRIGNYGDDIDRADLPSIPYNYNENRSFFEFFLRRHAGSDKRPITNPKEAREYALALVALGIDPRYQGRDNKGKKIDSINSFYSLTRSRGSEDHRFLDLDENQKLTLDLRLIAQKQLRSVSNNLMEQSPYELLRTAIYLEIQKLDNFFAFNTSSKVKKLRNAMRDLDQAFDPDKSSAKNYEALIAALENRNSPLCRALNTRRFVGLFTSPSTPTRSLKNVLELKGFITTVQLTTPVGHDAWKARCNAAEKKAEESRGRIPAAAVETAPAIPLSPNP